MVRRVLISGAGISGPTLACWLLRYGFEVTLVEAAPRLRTGGYIVDFWGTGFDVAGRMGILEEIRRRAYVVREVRVVNSQGKRVAGFPADSILKTTGGRYVSLPRGDLAEIIFQSIEGRAETIFGDSVRSLEETVEGVRVEFEHGPAREFDMVVGADGLHSRIRGLAFGPDARYETFLGYKVAAYTVDGYEPRDELTFLMYTRVGQQVSRFAMRDGRTMMLFIFADENADGPRDVEGQKALLRERFGKSGWECPQMLAALDRAGDFYFDRVSQIRMKEEEGLWTKGRVTLLGDAAFCVSLLAGQGAALAMTAAYVLAGELHRSLGNYEEACQRYQELFGPFVAVKQKEALRFAGASAPKTELGLWVRNQIFNLMRVGWIADLALGPGVIDRIELPEYEAG